MVIHPSSAALMHPPGQRTRKAKTTKAKAKAKPFIRRLVTDGSQTRDDQTARRSGRAGGME